MIAEGVGLSATPNADGMTAKKWVDLNKSTIGEIPVHVQYALLAQQLKVYTTGAKHVSGVVSPKLTAAQWKDLHPAMVELLTDLKYNGGYYATKPSQQAKKVNQVLLANKGKPLDQLKGVAKLLEGTATTLSFFDDYAERLAKSQGKTLIQNKETFFGQTKKNLNGAKDRRNRIRLGFLKKVIADIEGGRCK